MVVPYDVITQGFKAGHSASLLLLFKASAKKWLLTSLSTLSFTYTKLVQLKVLAVATLL
jgi:hypothetical protein